MQTSSRFVCTARFVEASTPDLCRPHMRFVEVRKLVCLDKFLQNPGGTLHCGEEIPVENLCISEEASYIPASAP